MKLKGTLWAVNERERMIMWHRLASPTDGAVASSDYAIFAFDATVTSEVNVSEFL